MGPVWPAPRFPLSAAGTDHTIRRAIELALAPRCASDPSRSFAYSGSFPVRIRAFPRARSPGWCAAQITFASENGALMSDPANSPHPFPAQPLSAWRRAVIKVGSSLLTDGRGNLGTRYASALASLIRSEERRVGKEC